jgi:hypothetical protein
MMTNRDHRSSLPSQPSPRLATLAWSFLAILLLTALLFVRQAEAATASSQGPTTISLEDEESELEAEELECEEEGEEESECEEEGEEVGVEGPLVLPAECLLRTAEARVSTAPGHNVVSLAIRYTSSTPTKVTVDYWLKGDKGSLQLGETTRRFAQQGVFRVDEHLSDRAMAKARAARTFIVQLDIAAAPSSCDRYSTQRLTARHMSGGHATWSRPS